MKISVLIALLLALAIPIFAEIATQPTAEANLDTALVSGKPTIALFIKSKACACTAKKCNAAGATFSQIVSDSSSEYTYLMVDIDKQPEYTKKLKLVAVPTAVFFDAFGSEVTRLSSWDMNAENISEALNSITTPKKTTN